MRWGLAVVACGLMMVVGCSSGSSSNQPSGPAPTQPPVANAGGPYTGTVGTPVNFSGSGSSDPQGQALTYAWDFGDGGKGTGVSPTHTYPQVAGVTTSTYTVSLIVTDTGGLSSQASTKATIQGVALLPDAAMTGVVTTGSKAIAGAHVYLFAANTAGYGQSSINLLSSTETGASDTLGAYVQTDSFGHFTMTGSYTCTAGQQLYLYALGGNSGAGTNAGAGLMAVIGSCPSSSGPAIAVTMNEVSTVAAAYAMAPYAVDVTHVSSSGTPLAVAGVANAFANAANLVTLSTAVALATTPAGNGSVPRNEINSLADSLEACVDLSSSSASSCTLLFTNALSAGATGTFPTETATAAINIAHNPGSNVTSVFNLPGGSPAYSPVLGAAPNDFTIAITFSGGALNGPRGVAVDAAGNAWITNGAGNSVTKLSSAGAVLSGTTGYTAGGLNSPYGIAIDSSGNAWIANSGNNSVTALTSTGAAVTGSPFSGGGLNGPRGVAADGSGNLWITNFGGNSVTKLTSSGAVASGSPFSGGMNQPFGIAIDGSGNAWIANFGGTSVTGLSSSGAAISGSPFSGGGLAAPVAIAVDGSGNVWAADNTGASVTKLSHAGAILSGTSGYTGGAIGSPYGIAIDGTGDAWIANQTPYSVTELSGTGSVLSGTSSFTSAGLNTPTAVAIDGSGDVWIANNTGNTVSEFIGAASPAVTPLAAGLSASSSADGSSKLGTRP